MRCVAVLCLLSALGCGDSARLEQELAATREELGQSRAALSECLAREVGRGGTPDPERADGVGPGTPPVAPQQGPPPIVPFRSRVRANSAGTPELAVWVRNDSEKAVDAVRFGVVCQNNFGEVVRSRIRREGAFRGSFQAERDRERLMPGQERRLAHWSMFRFDGCTKAKVTVDSVHFVDGETWAGAAEQEGFPDSAI